MVLNGYSKEIYNKYDWNLNWFFLFNSHYVKLLFYILNSSKQMQKFISFQFTRFTSYTNRFNNDGEYK